jgi:mRNA interferase MazF
LLLRAGPAPGVRGRHPLVIRAHEIHNGPSHRITGVPCTTKGRGFATEIPLASLPKPCVALIDQITTVDWVAREAEYRGEKASKAELDAIRRSIAAFLMLG